MKPYKYLLRDERDSCACGQDKHPLMEWCYQCRRHIAALGDMSRLLILSRIKDAELNLAHLRASLEEGNGSDVA